MIPISLFLKSNTWMKLFSCMYCIEDKAPAFFIKLNCKSKPFIASLVYKTNPLAGHLL